MPVKLLHTTNHTIPFLRSLLCVSMFLVFQFSFFSSAQAQRPKTPTVMSVGDLLPNYGLDNSWVVDTAAAVDYLEQQPQDYVALTNLCVSLRTKAQAALSSLSTDYLHRDSLVWLDSNIVLSDYTVYQYYLRNFADLMGRRSIHYSRIEQQRVEAEKEAARLRAIEEARRQQEARDKEAADLRNSIELHHRTIISACDGAGVSDRTKLKYLKDLYYSYLMVYNKYDLSKGHASQESLEQLDELNSFQLDMLENLLGNNSLPAQIDNFKSQLKARCEKDNSDVYRSYSRMFRQSPLPPVSFADVREYEDYLNRLRTVTNVQQRYMQAIELRTTIEANTQSIVNLYGRKYREIVSSYKDVVRSIDMVPAFTTNAESVNFIQKLHGFIDAQQRYIDYFGLRDDITRRTDSITSSRNSIRDVTRAYNDVLPSLIPLPKFKDVDGAEYYYDQLVTVEQIQQCYLDVIRMRHEIERLDDSVSALRKSDRTLYKGYKLLHKQADLSPRFSTLERGRSAITVLTGHVEMQQLCLESFRKRQKVDAASKRIESMTTNFRNIRKAYSRLEDLYLDFGEITNQEDLRRYSRQLDHTAVMQEAFISTLTGDLVNDAESKLRRETDVDKIKLVIGL